MDLAAAVFAAMALVSMASYFAQRSARRSSALAAAGLAGDTAARPRPSLHIFQALRSGLTRLGLKVSPRPQEGIQKLLEESGSAWTPHFLQGMRIAVGLALTAPALTPGPAGLVLAPILFAAGYHAPLMALKRRRARRWLRLACDLPEIVDLMAVLCFSGESLLRALRHAASACTHADSREEMESVLERIRMGESTAEALRRASAHPCREMRRFGRTMLRAEVFGAPVADTLEELAVEFRNGRRERDRVRASRISVLILLPLVFLILPSFLLLTVGGMILGHTP